jgi:sodium-dependent dicarboxylate transporter 2/3/5
MNLIPSGGATTDGQVFEKWRKRAGVVLTPLAFLLVYHWCSSLPPEGRSLSAILAAIAMLWISEIIPLAVSALFGAVLCVLLGVTDARSALAYFADPIVFVFIGGFIIARAMTVHGLDKRIALGLLSIPWIGTSPVRIMAGIGLVAALMSMWVSNTAVAAMMLPIALGVLDTLHRLQVARGTSREDQDVHEWPFATGMMLMIAYGSSVGGIGTPIGTPPNLIGIGLIRSATGVDISFFRWMALAIPLFLVMGIILFFLLYALHPVHPRNRKEKQSPEPKTSSGDLGSQLLVFIRGEREKLGPWTRGQINTLIAFGVAVTLWILPGILQIPLIRVPWLAHWLNTHLPESIVAILAAILLFMLPISLSQRKFTLSWPEAVRIDWGTILLFGGGLTLGSLMFKTGVSEAMGYALTNRLGIHTVWLLTGLSIILSILLTEVTSNTAAANMIIPVVIAIAQSAHVSPLPPALGACLGASFGFMLPVSTPPNAIVYGSGMILLPKMLRAGILLDVIGFFVVWVGLYILCPLLGLM